MGDVCGLSKDFFDMTPKAQATMAKINNWDYINLKRFSTAKEITNKMNRKPKEWEKTFANHIDKGLMFKIYKELTELNSKKQTKKYHQAIQTKNRQRT